jgi:DNA-3-methyladenine glycosylase
MIDTILNQSLPRNFYIRPVLTVAKELLGKILVKNDENKIIAGRIIEVEAYDGKNDEASHSFKGKTKRNEVMFNLGGFFYVYFTYGTHYCCNVVTGEKNHGAAVLIRAIEPLGGTELMIKRRFGRKLKDDKEIFNLTSGPGKLCQAFGFNKNHSGIDLTGKSIYLVDQPKLKKNKIGNSKRIGISKSTELEWRFFEIGNKYLSR